MWSRNKLRKKTSECEICLWTFAETLVQVPTNETELSRKVLTVCSKRHSPSYFEVSKKLFTVFYLVLCLCKLGFQYYCRWFRIYRFIKKTPDSLENLTWYLLVSSDMDRSSLKVSSYVSCWRHPVVDTLVPCGWCIASREGKNRQARATLQMSLCRANSLERQRCFPKGRRKRFFNLFCHHHKSQQVSWLSLIQGLTAPH